jgi:hypothetical protein
MKQNQEVAERGLQVFHESRKTKKQFLWPLLTPTRFYVIEVILDYKPTKF